MQDASGSQPDGSRAVEVEHGGCSRLAAPYELDFTGKCEKVVVYQECYIPGRRRVSKDAQK